MRHDVVGLFWDDTPAVRERKEKIKRTPPEPVWEREDYLPGLAEAIRYQLSVISDAELVAASESREAFVFDVEVYPNFFCVTFTSTATGRSVAFELSDYEMLDIPKMAWCYANLQLVGFNSTKYDRVIMAMALKGHTTEQLQWATDQLITFDTPYWKFMKANKLVDPVGFDHIDLIEVAPLSASLKIYGARLFCRKMQDLPFKPGTMLSYEQQRIVKMYNANDNEVTALLYNNLREQIKLREVLGARYKLDLRSKSDAQIAEAIFSVEIQRITGKKPKKPVVDYNLRFRYETPSFIKFQTPLLTWALQQVQAAEFYIDESGHVRCDSDFGKKKGLQLEIAGKLYTVGLGGLHSNEKSEYYLSTATHKLLDRDVTSYYPSLMINSGKVPAQMPYMMHVFVPIIEERKTAKAAGDKTTADSLKIVGNGTFGKTSDPTSIVYAPPLMIQTTVTGQMSILMLIERMALNHIPVINANTDGIVMHVPVEKHELYLQIIQQWEQETSLQTEETEYAAYYTRDVNNYIAVKPDGKCKGKGVYANPWGDPKAAIFRFHKNPVNIICTEAVENYLVKGVPVIATVTACNDPHKFTTAMKGGGRSNGVDYGGVFVEPEAEPLYLGKAVRWYMARDSKGMIVKSHNGNMVTNSEGCRPIMEVTGQLPPDLDTDWYVQEARNMLAAMGIPQEYAQAA